MLVRGDVTDRTFDLEIVLLLFGEAGGARLQHVLGQLVTQRLVRHTQHRVVKLLKNNNDKKKIDKVFVNCIV